MCADLRLSCPQNTRSLGLELIARGKNIINLVTNVMDAARRVLVEETLDRRTFSEGVEQLDLGVGQLDEDDGYTVVGLVLWGADIGPEHVAVLRRSSLQIRHSNCHVVKSSDHEMPPRA